ncbi:IS66 family transposase, partial [Paracoccus rhizosphaerae]|uniref:IS66 family transposase n=1 Tax=Paracoccus rhizosphaerae TaxID=1133347 RepID=UPI00406BC103
MKKTDAIFDVERQSNGMDTALRLEARQRLVRLLVEDLHDWMRAEQGTMSKYNPVAKANSYMFKKDRWAAFTLFLDDGRICLTRMLLNSHFLSSFSVLAACLS